MLFAEVIVALIFILAATFVVRVAAKKWRRAGVVGKMHEIEETAETAQAVRRFKKDHPNPGADHNDVDKFQQGR
jgi:transposase